MTKQLIIDGLLALKTQGKSLEFDRNLEKVCQKYCLKCNDSVEPNSNEDYQCDNCKKSHTKYCSTSGAHCNHCLFQVNREFLLEMQKE